MSKQTKRHNPINRPVSPEVESLLSPSAQNLLSLKEQDRKVIPVEDRQDAVKKIATWLTAAESLPDVGEVVSLKFDDGGTWDVRVSGWDKDYVSIEIPSATAPEGHVPGNMDMGSFVNLVHEPHNPQDPSQS